MLTSGSLLLEEIDGEPLIFLPVVTENSVRAENAEVPRIHEILVLPR